MGESETIRGGGRLRSSSDSSESVRRNHEAHSGFAPNRHLFFEERLLPIRSVRRAWRTALDKAGVSYFPIYNLRHVFCTRLSWVAPDAVVQRAMRHSIPETKRHYQLGMVDQVREGIERANKKAYEGQKLLRSYYGASEAEKEAAEASVSS
jgi:integrase